MQEFNHGFIITDPETHIFYGLADTMEVAVEVAKIGQMTRPNLVVMSTEGKAFTSVTDGVITDFVWHTKA